MCAGRGEQACGERCVSWGEEVCVCVHRCVAAGVCVSLCVSQLRTAKTETEQQTSARGNP